MTPKQISIILHLYQPSIQTASVFKQIYESSYQPLLKILKNNKNANFTLNMPLSLLEIMDSYGYSSWLSDIAKLYETGKIELTGTGAYHPLLSQFNEKMREDQIVLNEYGLGYYFGKRTGFEGEKSILLKDVNGFFPPELAVDEAVLRTISGLNYSWILIDQCAIESYSNPIVEHASGIVLVVRNTQISNNIAFNRGFNTNPVVEMINDSTENSIIIALDGETFGHHNKEGILYLDTLIDSLASAGHNLRKVSDTILYNQHEHTLSVCEKIMPSTWGATLEDVQKGNILPFWKIEGNFIQNTLWELYSFIAQRYDNCIEPKCDTHNLENLPVWKNDTINSFESDDLKKYIMTKMSYARLVASDVAWWASNKELFNGEHVFDPLFISNYLEFASTVADFTSDDELKVYIEKVRSQVHLQSSKS